MEPGPSRQDERFNLNRYRDHTQRRGTLTPQIGPVGQDQHILPTFVHQPISQLPNESSSPEDWYRYLVSLQRSQLGQIGSRIFPPPSPTSPTVINPPTTPVVTLGQGHNASPTTNMSFTQISRNDSRIPNSEGIPSQPPATPSATAPLLGRLEILLARQAAMMRNYEEMLAMQRSARDETEKQRKQISTTTANAILALAERVHSVAQDVTTIRDVLGIPSKVEVNDGARMMKKERGSRPTTSADTLTGKNPSNAIVIDEDEELTEVVEVPTPVPPRSIMDRLDSMETDFAEFMERVKDPDANITELRGYSKIATTLYQAKELRDVGTSPTIPSLPPVASPTFNDEFTIGIDMSIFESFGLPPQGTAGSVPAEQTANDETGFMDIVSGDYSRHGRHEPIDTGIPDIPPNFVDFLAFGIGPNDVPPIESHISPVETTSASTSPLYVGDSSESSEDHMETSKSIGHKGSRSSKRVHDQSPVDDSRPRLKRLKRWTSSQEERRDEDQAEAGTRKSQSRKIKKRQDRGAANSPSPGPSKPVSAKTKLHRWHSPSPNSSLDISNVKFGPPKRAKPKPRARGKDPNL